MKRIARVLLLISEDALKEVAKDEQNPTFAEALQVTLDEFVKTCNSHTDEPYAHAEFLEWEDFCPNCESVSLSYGGVHDGKIGGRKYTCEECGHTFLPGKES